MLDTVVIWSGKRSEALAEVGLGSEKSEVPVTLLRPGCAGVCSGVEALLVVLRRTLLAMRCWRNDHLVVGLARVVGLRF